MAGFMGVESLRSEIEQNLEWLYQNNITYTKQVIDGSNIKDFVKIGASNLLAEDLACCWWRMLETKCFGDNLKMLVTTLAILVANIHYFFHKRLAPTLKRCHQDRHSVTNIQKLSPTLSYQHHCYPNDDKIKGPLAIFFGGTRLEVKNNNFSWFLNHGYWICVEILARKLLWNLCSHLWIIDYAS